MATFMVIVVGDCVRTAINIRYQIEMTDKSDETDDTDFAVTVGSAKKSN